VSKSFSAKLERMAWPATLQFTSFGVRIGVRADDNAILEQALPCLPSNLRPSRSVQVDRRYSLFRAEGAASGDAPAYFLYADRRKLAQGRQLSTVIEALESDVNFHIARTSQRWVFVHAGAVAWKGQAIVIPGASFSGKSALVKELLAHGAEYYSDEFSAFYASGRVHPFPRRLCLRDDQKCQTLVTAKELGAKTGTRPLPVALVIITRYKPNAVWRPRVVSTGEGVLELLGNSLTARSRPTQALAALSKAVSTALVLDGPRGDAKATAASILRILDWAHAV